MKFKFLLIIGIFSLTLNSCNWVRHQLGMMTSGEIAELKSSIEGLSAKDTLDTDISDSLRLDSLNYSESNIDEENNNSNIPITSSGKSADQSLKTQKNTSAKTTTDGASSKEGAYKQLNDKRDNDGFYIILGSFKSKQNAEKLYREVINSGSTAALLQKDNGFVMVGVGGYTSMEEAEKNMVKWKDNKLCSGGLWIYNSKTGR